MKTLEQLLDVWEDATLTTEEIADLKSLLRQPEARAALAAELHLHGTLREILKAPRRELASAPVEASEEDRDRVILDQAAPPAPERRERWRFWRGLRTPLRGMAV